MSLVNVAATNVTYFTPARIPPSGTAVVKDDGKPAPKIFKPIKIRGVEFHNRIFVSPLCQYSADNGRMTAWHMAHLGGIGSRGPGLVVIEASSVSPEGRLSPEDLGVWSDDQIAPMREVVDFIHSQGTKVGIQLGHGGRKASTVAPWLAALAIAPPELGGWPDDVWGPSTIPYSEDSAIPKELTVEGIKRIVKAFADGAKRAVLAGVDVIEIHSAHGFLLHSFLSPFSNKRTDDYGGSFENRIRFLLETVGAIRDVIPHDTPLFVRISADDWLEKVFPNEPSWTLQDSVKLAGILAQHGVDLIDVSSAGTSPKQGVFRSEDAYHAVLSETIKKAHGLETPSKLFVSAVGGIKTGHIAENVLVKEQADVVFVGRQFQKDPATVWTFAEQLGVEIAVANQIGWGFGLSKSGRGQSGKGTLNKAASS